MLTAVLTFLGSVISALPKILQFVSDWRKQKAAERDKTTKDTRNEEALQRALDRDRSP